MAKLKAAFDPFGVDTPPPAPPPAPPAAPAGETPAPAPAQPRKPRQAPKAAPPAPPPAPAAEVDGPPIPPLFARISASDDDWLREVRYRHRVPAAALVRALIRLAQADEDLLAEALDRARSDMVTERPGPRRQGR